MKNKNNHPSCKIYKGVCSCNEIYIGETNRNVSIRWSEHNDGAKGTSEPAKHLRKFPSHVFEWSIIANAHKNKRTRKNLEAFFISLEQPKINDQKETFKLNLFRNGIT